MIIDHWILISLIVGILIGFIARRSHLKIYKEGVNYGFSTAAKTLKPPQRAPAKQGRN